MRSRSILMELKQEEPQKREKRIKAITRDEWIAEHSFWVEKFAIHKWELETTEEMLKRGSISVAKIQKDISDFLDNYAFHIDELNAMSVAELKSLVKEDIAFAERVFDEKPDVVNFT